MVHGAGHADPTAPDRTAQPGGRSNGISFPSLFRRFLLFINARSLLCTGCTDGALYRHSEGLHLQDPGRDSNKPCTGCCSNLSHHCMMYKHERTLSSKAQHLLLHARNADTYVHSEHA